MVGVSTITVAEAAERYGAAPRTVKRWKAIGKKAGDVCPLADPERMLGWWQRNMRQRIPDGINLAVIEWRKAHGVLPATVPIGPVAVGVGSVQALAQGAGGPAKRRRGRPRKGEAVGEELGAVVPVPGVPVAPLAPLVAAAGMVAIGETGLAAELARLEILASRLGALADQPGQTKPYLDTLARMSALSVKLREEAEKEGKLLPRDMVEDALRGFHATIEREFRMMYRSMCEVAQIVPTPQREAQWNALCDELFERMGQEVLR